MELLQTLTSKNTHWITPQDGIEQLSFREQLASMMGVSCVQLSAWLYGNGLIPIEQVPKIVHLSHGKVTAHQLRPDVFIELEPLD